MAKNNGHQNFTKGLGIPTPPPYLGNIPKKIFWGLPLIAVLATPTNTGQYL